MGTTRKRTRIITLIIFSVIILSAALIAAGCGGSSKNSDSKPVIGYMAYRDATGLNDEIVAKCEKAGNGKYSIKTTNMGPTVDAAREQLSRRLAAKDDSMDILTLDTVWTAEFSDAGWIMDVTEKITPIEDTLVGAAVDSARYKDKIWAYPIGTNVPLLYYRSDLVEEAPSTWNLLAKAAKAAQEESKSSALTGFVFQGNQYEGGTVDAVEFISSNGGRVLNDAGDKVELTQDGAAVEALTFVQNLVKDGVSPKMVATFTEEEGRQLFQKGDAVFMRNWPYAYPLLANEPTSKVKGNFKVAPLPAFEGGVSSGVIGGQNFAINAHSKHAELAWEIIQCIGSEESQIQKALKKGELPTLKKLYKDERLSAELPFIPIAGKALETAVNRPTSPYYNDLTLPIYKGWNDVVSGREEPAKAVKSMEKAIERAIAGKADI